MANNIRVHTDANFRIRDGLGTVMRSARMFNQNNCMNERSLRRNIISNHFVQPYTQRFDDSTCDYNIARDSELRSNNLQYHFRPQNMEVQMGLGENHQHTIGSSNLDKMYGLPGSGSTMVNPNLNFTQSSSYYPYAYGGDLTGVGSNVMGEFSHTAKHGPTYPAEYYAYRTPGNMQTLMNSSDSRNFGALPPKDSSGPIGPTPTHYNNNTVDDDGKRLLNYMELDTERQFNRSNYPMMKGMVPAPAAPPAAPPAVPPVDSPVGPPATVPTTSAIENYMIQPQARNGYYGLESDFYY